MAADPAARLTASPMNVEVCVPGDQWAMNAARPTTADRASPPPMPLPTVIRSGTTPQCSAAQVRPVRPNPHWTSSKMRTAPWRSHSSRSPARKPSGGMTTPPLPWTGSTTTAATGPIPEAGSSSAWRTSARAISPAAVARAERPAIRIRVGQEVGIRVAPDRCAHPRLAVEADDPAAATEVAAREGDDLVPPGQRPGQLERGVVGVRAAQPEQHPIEPGRRDRHERLLERDPRLAHRRGRDVAQPPDLVADGGHDRRMAMADGRRREAAGEVDEAIPVRVGQRRADRGLDDERRIVRAGPRPGALDRAHPLDDPGRPRTGVRQADRRARWPACIGRRPCRGRLAGRGHAGSS